VIVLDSSFIIDFYNERDALHTFRRDSHGTFPEWGQAEACSYLACGAVISESKSGAEGSRVRCG
jgi:hypothetical protein